jgi:hypothetical protein
MFAAILAIGLALAISLSSRILAGQPLDAAYQRAQAEIEQLKREQADLLAEHDYVVSDAFVEQWARDEGKMIREGEVLVVPVPSGANVAATPTAEPRVVVETTLPEPDPWVLWWALFFDSPPPQLAH